jgi:Sulfatase-modifying factor enzyme 1
VRVKFVVAVVILLVALGGAAWLRPMAMPTWRPELASTRPHQEVDEGLEIELPKLAQVESASEQLGVEKVNVPEAMASTVEAPSLPVASPLSSTLCPERMVWVSGPYCPAPPELTGERCPVPPLDIGVCMDMFEYPNQPGVLPAVMLRADEANQLCAAEGKRLCRESEWTFACRSTREPNRCNFGHSADIRVERLWDPALVSGEVAARDGRRPSFEGGCVDDFGVYDLLGNIQEWALSEMTEYGAALKGGRFNQPGEGCERSIRVKQKWSRYPHTGLRCCRDPLVELPERR